MFCVGDRVRWATTDGDGLPVVRYGFVGGVASEVGPALVMLDGELAGEVVVLAELEPVSVTTVELHLAGDDLIEDPDLRRGLVHLWQAEAESAGLAVDGVETLGAGRCDDGRHWSLAEMSTGGDRYVVRAMRSPLDPAIVCIRAELA
ncbi:MAG: hypothetical protein M3487_02755 [Actinomycetota bacterium]|nr:hypothetical protein [Actinomycetota bacterium]